MLPRPGPKAAAALAEPRHERAVPLVRRARTHGLPFGTLRSFRRGGGADVVGSRPYRPGDDLRLIDHAASARLSAAVGRDEYVVREHHADAAASVVVAIDRRPSMSLFPDDLPWLHKPAAVEAAAAVLAASARRARCPLRVVESAEDPLAAAGALRPRRGSFVFVLSDFLEFPPQASWRDAGARGWDVVPLVLQDPLWEQSFPDAGGLVLPLADADSGRRGAVRFTRREAAERRRLNEERLRSILARLKAFALEPVLIDDAAPDLIFSRLSAWADSRSGRTAWR